MLDIPPELITLGLETRRQSHLQYVQEDIHEWKFETTQSLQRAFMAQLKDTQTALLERPERPEAYLSLQNQLESHCQRVYNGTCEWQFSPPFDPRSAAATAPAPPPLRAAVVYVCCADAQELGDLLWSLQVDGRACGRA